MTDLSQPTLSLMPPDELPPSGSTVKPVAFLWPTPPYASYPEPTAPPAGEACDIEGPNGQVMRGRLILFLPEEQMVQVQLPPSRTTWPLRFNEFRALTLQRPLRPDSGVEHGPRAEVLRQRPRSLAHVTYADGREEVSETIGHVETAFGLFLFPPIDASDAVRRVFTPRPAYRARARAS